VESVLSLPNQGYALDDFEDSVLPHLEDLGLADIRIPAANDDDLEGYSQHLFTQRHALSDN